MKITRQLLDELERRTGAEISVEILPGGMKVIAESKDGSRQWERVYGIDQVAKFGEYERDRLKEFWAGVASEVQKAL